MGKYLLRTSWAQFLQKVEIEYKLHTSTNNKKSIRIGSQLYIMYYSYSKYLAGSLLF